MVTINNDIKNRFRDILVQHRLAHLEQSIANRFPWQTKLAILELLTHAYEAKAKTIFILTGTATEGFYGAEIAEKLRACMEADTKVYILVWNDRDRAAPGLLNALKTKFPERLYTALAGTRTAGEQISHFLLVDESAYRLEQPHSYFDESVFDDVSPETPARICFNDRKGGAVLANMFRSLWNAAGGSPAFPAAGRNGGVQASAAEEGL